MEAIKTIESVRTFETRGGNTRYVVRVTDGDEYTTFRETIGGRAAELEGRRVRIEYHQEERGRFTNVYLDKVEPAPDELYEALKPFKDKVAEDIKDAEAEREGGEAEREGGEAEREGGEAGLEGGDAGLEGGDAGRASGETGRAT
jgi:hypothetical protein